eukprot:COSAG01_NODE_6667_length_3555_cov_33.351273_3_plen_111_part_00
MSRMRSGTRPQTPILACRPGALSRQSHGVRTAGVRKDEAALVDVGARAPTRVGGGGETLPHAGVLREFFAGAPARFTDEAPLLASGALSSQRVEVLAPSLLRALRPAPTP